MELTTGCVIYIIGFDNCAQSPVDQQILARLLASRTTQKCTMRHLLRMPSVLPPSTLKTSCAPTCLRAPLPILAAACPGGVQ